MRSRTGLHTSIRRRSPAPTGFFSVSSPPPGPLWLYLPAARPTFYSNLLVLTCSLLYPLLFRDPPPYASFPTFPPSACRSHSRAPGVGPQCSIHRATKRTAQASADLPGSHFRLGGNPRDTHMVGVVSTLLSIPLITKDLNSQTVRGGRGADSLKSFYGLLRLLYDIAIHRSYHFIETLAAHHLFFLFISRSTHVSINRRLKGLSKRDAIGARRTMARDQRDDTATMVVVLSERIVRGASSVCRAL